mmetsp:Transcript_8622/g.19377  ORF Transcript_8622/g.19377 Transcript_8622/m.19377 type:complete len:547 (-) Transcript_8622:30-1670(-)
MMEAREQKESQDASPNWWWPRKRQRSSNSDSEVLRLPNFLSDASKLLEILDAKDGTIHPREPIINGLIEARIDSLSGLFRPRNSIHGPQQHHDHRPAMKTRATDMSDKQLADWVLKGACSEKFLRPKRNNPDSFNEGKVPNADDNFLDNSTNNNNDEVMEKIAQQYQSRREELLSMEKSLHASRQRHNNHIPQLDDPLPEVFIHHPVEMDDAPVQNDVRIDRYGRLVRIRNESLNRREEGRRNGENNGHTNDGNDQAEESELVDASETFWRHHAESQHRNESGVTVDSMSDMAVAPPPPPMVNQPMRLRDVSQRMDRDACRAIQSALDRYRLQEEELSRQQNPMRENADRLDFELIHIPLTVNEGGPHWLSLFQFDRDQNQDRNENERDDAGGQNGNRQEQGNRQGDMNGGNWLDLRLALRRVCYAVITVAAAFICIMIQGLPFDLRDGIRLEAGGLWMSGLMGPHFEGHHRVSQVTNTGAQEFPDENGEAGEDEDPSPFAVFRSKKIIADLPPSHVHVPIDEFGGWKQARGIKEENVCDNEGETG